MENDQEAEIKGIFFQGLLRDIERKKGTEEKEKILKLLPRDKYYGFQFYSWREYRTLQEETMKTLFGKIDNDTWEELAKMVIEYFRRITIGKTLLALCSGDIMRGIDMAARTMGTFTKGVQFTTSANTLESLQIRVTNIVEEPIYWKKIWEELADAIGYKVKITYEKLGERDYLYKGIAEPLN
ncbi:MAG: TIGR02265 family protein [Candidatus Heimdallarchaeota archaeon]